MATLFSKLLCLSVILLSISSVFSAGPVFHLWTGEKFCDALSIPKGQERAAILVGTEFPDIRYMAHFPRNLTHPVVLDVRDILTGKTPFEIGMRIHSWLDYTRENRISKEVYDALAPYSEDQGQRVHLLKMVEEEILADIYDGRPCSAYFDSIHSEELAYADEQMIWNWHSYIQWSLALRLSWALWAQSYRGDAFGLTAQTLYNWSYLLPKLKEQPIFKNHLYQLLEHIESELQKIQINQ
jgi:hypothetical protein